MNTPQNSNFLYDVIVVGLGAHGSATFFHLAKQGLKVLGLERFELAHTQGSSHGDTRITRKMVFEHPVYVDLVTEAYEAFDELSKIANRPIFKQTGGLFMGKPDSDLVKQCLHVAKAKNLPIKILNSKQINQLNPQFDLQGKDDIVGVYDQEAGVLFPENCIQSFVEQGVKRYGGRVQTGTRYISHSIVPPPKEDPGSKTVHETVYEVVTDCGKFRTKKIVFSCGMWNTQIINAPLEIRKIQLFWFKVPENVNMDLDHCPIFMYEVDRNPLYYVYGFPNYQGSGIKVGFSPNQHNNITQSPDRPIRSVEPQEKTRIVHMMKEFLPNIGRQPVIDEKECFVTMAPDENFIIDFDPNDKNILYLSPCSAHGFKYSGGVGRLAARMIKHGRHEDQYSMFRLNRFENQNVQWSDLFIKQDLAYNPFSKYFQNPTPKL
ncbi:monomeric sarcosine oxidase (macronuclear) [Tetrahymena thermophila SB210]|uniref:Monomeric sarcosine oxidase n=1 Tax=Tetrahymena thermophila (strain SB210) TaxID=312017 RepID=Q22P49_TETTS|nr:monomeric sarcosine oxidase [Tetrahymena thermophila SB210]EAR86962.1 monomeric sarcosine oxidase [Tetrahymena thermophila SB210]|eukprot:XP_001007207.1 monomeric sarcosine oxidase [Tetrahymena thermophila SB210]